ncbi:protein kinase, partial [Helicosporidium sp. ATCC 50920]
VAIKLLPSILPNDGPGVENLREALMREVSLASRFDCERLVRVHGASVRDARNVCLIMELMRGGNLAQRIHDRHKRRLGYLDILRLAHDVASALAYLHPTVVHRDLKPQNVLLDEDGRAKLADFGISRAKDPTKSYFTQVTAENGTPMYMSPEQLDGKDRVTEKVDVYSLGVMLNEAWTRRQPWRDTPSLFQIILKVAINGERPWMDPACPEPLKWLILKCWHQQAHMRPSCAEIVRITDILMQNEFARWGPALGPPALRSSLSPSSSTRSSPRHSSAA